MTLVAHAGHWFEGLLYLAPVLAMLGALGWAKLRARRNTDREHDV